MKKRPILTFPKSKKDLNINYPSAPLLLELSKEEYVSERDRSNTLDNKANVFMSAIIAVSTIFIPIIPFSKISTVYISDNKFKIIVTTLFLFLLVLASIFVVIAFYNLYQSFKLKKFTGINYENLNDEYVLIKPINDTEKAMIDHLNSIIKNNLEINDEKAKKIVIGLRYSTISFILLCISTIGLIILLGGGINA